MITPPVLIYLGMGLLVALIMLDGRQTRCFTLLEWLQYGVDALRITLLWPLVLLAEKIETWRETGHAKSVDVHGNPVAPCAENETPLPAENPAKASPPALLVVEAVPETEGQGKTE